MTKSLENRAIFAQRLKYSLKTIPGGILIGIDSLADSILDDISRQVTSFDKFCDNVAGLAQNACYETCQKLSSFFGLPFLIVPVGWKRKRSNRPRIAGLK